jgi:hypothetical protein
LSTVITRREVQARVQGLLDHPEADLLWQDQPVAISEFDVDRQAPFNKAINVYNGGTAK